MAPRFGNNMARMRLLLAQRAGYLPRGQLPANATAAWHGASKNLKRDAMQAGQANPMAFLRNRIQGLNHPPPMPPQPMGVQPDAGNLRNQNGPGNISWGGQRFGDPRDLYNWEAAHGNKLSYKQFYQQHPEAASLLGAFANPAAGAAGRGGAPVNALREFLLQRRQRRNPLRDQQMDLY